MLSTMAPVHNLLAPLTERFNLRITTPPRTVPITDNGMQTTPDTHKQEATHETQDESSL